jgi:molecular chaperone DnaK
VKNYIGIDLGTTNSAICSFDGENLKLFKSPEQNDVTPSAIYVGRRGNRFLGIHAYNNAAKEPDNAATLFKRLMGTSTPVKLSAVNITMTPEECSAEILRLLFGYLPEEIRNNSETGTVITVPAAFNQMQKDATMSAANLAGIGKVALMQEPVAAVMSVMRQRKGDGVFLVYDLGGGTLDIAIAESISGRVNVLAHGGIEMCGGRDFDRIILHDVVKPWLLDKFNLPNDLSENHKFKPLITMATWVAERAKISLSSRDDVLISDPAFDAARFKDLSGEEIYLDIPFARSLFDEMIHDTITESIRAAHETMERAGFGPHDVERVVFIGGPTNYKPLRDRVCTDLGISASTDIINPMTAVAEGAAVFAESIDWSSQSRGRKSTRGTASVNGTLQLAFDYIARTPDAKSRIAVKLGGAARPGTEFQIESLDTGWSSGRMPLKNGSTIEIPLSKRGENTFKIWVFDAEGGPISLENSKIIINRTAATIDGIPASSSIGIAVLEKLGGRPALLYLVKKGDPLPKKGKIDLKAAESLRADTSGALHFQIFEGENKYPEENRPIGELRINGTDFKEGGIRQGAQLICEYEVLDSGTIHLEVSVPDIGATFGKRNLYSRQAGQIDFTDASKQIISDAEMIRARLESVSSKVDDPKLDQAREKLDQAASISEGEADPERAKKAMDDVQEAKNLLARVRNEHLKDIRQLDLDKCTNFFDSHIRQHSRPTEASAFDNLARTAQRAIDNNTNDFENILDELRGRNFQILWRQDWFVIDRFETFAKSPYMFADKRQHADLVAIGAEAIQADDIDKLRRVVAELYSLKIGTELDDDMLASVNILRG